MVAAEGRGYPRIVVIDDQFGRCGLGGSFRHSVTADVFAGYEADRQNLCLNYGLLDVTGDAPRKEVLELVAEATFCPAQVWDDAAQRIEPSVEAAIRVVRRGWPFEDSTRWALVLLDLRFVHGSLNVFGDPQEGSLFGIDVLLPRLRAEFGEDLPIVVLSSTNRDENNEAVRRHGALDYIQRVPGLGPPRDIAREALRRALSKHGLLEDMTGSVVGRSLPVLKMLRQARRGAASARNILLVGETGTGKGLLAHYIHSVSARRDGPYEVFHAAQRPAELQAAELFGHWKGAFTGATGETAGIWERADGGTLFVDEVADIDQHVQQMLMQPIEERKVRRLGSSGSASTRPKDVDVLLLLATNQNLSASVGHGHMRIDFLNRINAFLIEVPPLRERMEDLPELVAHLSGMLAPEWSGRFLPEATAKLLTHQWSEGNIRELRNVIERALVNNPDQDITARDLVIVTRVDRSRSQNASVEPEQHDDDFGTWQSMVKAIGAPPGLLSVDDCEAAKETLRGSFLEVVAHILEWALELTAQEGRPNLTAAARFLLGRDDVSTMEAKQFVKKLLTLDTRGKTIARRLEQSSTLMYHETLKKLMTEILK